MTPDVDIILLGGAAPRLLELTLDSVIGQTEQRFRLLASRTEIGPAGAALLAEYADPRLVVMNDTESCTTGLRGRHVALLQAGDLLMPTYLAHMSAALLTDPGKDFAVCGATLFDGAILRDGTTSAASNLMVRAEMFPAEGLELNAVAAFCGRMLDSGGGVAVARKLAIIRIHGDAPLFAAAPRLPTTLFGRRYSPADIDTDRPPTLHVVVDTEAEFDWAQPFATDLTAVSAMSGIASAQAIFDRYGLRPLYVVDYPVASQPESVAAIRPIAARGGCAIGAHLHPWANPPFGEDTTRRLSFPGNLPGDLEAAKLDSLLNQIHRSFATTPPFYKAGRYGLGPNTAALIASRGARVDYSLLPQTDLRAQDGPDFRFIDPVPYRVEGTSLLSLPMTRAHIGALAGPRPLNAWLDSRLAASLHLPGLLARARLLERVTLTPEGMPAASQIRLIRALLGQGHRLFVLHFHSPSLVAGHTPYVRTEADRVVLLERIDEVCRWFFETLGGLPGRPWDLLDHSARTARAA